MNKNIVFVHIPKTGGYATSRCLQKAGRLLKGFGFKHQFAEQYIPKNHRHEYPILSIVRNPYDRLYSIYEYYRNTKPVSIPEISFKEFIMTFEENFYNKKIQFTTCYEFLVDDHDKLIPTDILHFENLQQEYDDFCKKYNIENLLVEMNHNKNKNIDVNPENLYDVEMKEVVERVFKKDLETFDYSYEDFIKTFNKKYHDNNL